MEPIIKQTTTKLTYRIEEKPGGGFIARSDDPSAETFEGATRDEVQQKINDKLLALVGDALHHKITLGDSINVSFTEKVSTKFSISKPSQDIAEQTEVSSTSEPHFESGNFWLWLALLIAIGVVVVYLLRR